VTTLIAEVILRWILRLAIRAYARKLRPALTAKLCLFSIIKLAFWAFHYWTPLFFFKKRLFKEYMNDVSEYSS
jgi:hypothetical protein